MRVVEPKVFLIGETRLVDNGDLDAYLKDIGAGEFSFDEKISDSEKILETMGRLCYRSFVPGLNENVRKVREGNDVYLANIRASKHGAVLEHGWVNFVLHNISRVVTHELTRHRVGVAYSQESLRYVRLSDLKVWLPNFVFSYPGLYESIMTGFESIEDGLKKANKIAFANEQSFHLKKRVTSLIRRIAPIGLATTLGFSANFRILRHQIELRTHRSAEDEIRLVFGQIAEIMIERYPNVFGDFKREMVDDYYEYTTEFSKV